MSTNVLSYEGPELPHLERKCRTICLRRLKNPVNGSQRGLNGNPNGANGVATPGLPQKDPVCRGLSVISPLAGLFTRQAKPILRRL